MNFFKQKNVLVFVFVLNVIISVLLFQSSKFDRFMQKQRYQINSPTSLPIAKRYFRNAEVQEYQIILQKITFKNDQEAQLLPPADYSTTAQSTHALGSNEISRSKHDIRLTKSNQILIAKHGTQSMNQPAHAAFNHNPQEVKFTRTNSTKCLTRNIVFVKTHKTAGTSVQNVLIRYGLKRRLKFALPAIGWNDYPNFFASRKVLYPGLKPFNIICHHMRFNYEEVKKIMAKTPLYITILREPGELFQSTFDFFYGTVPQFHNVPHRSDNAAGNWLDLALSSNKLTTKTKFGHFSKNHLMFDLGYSEENNNETYISEAIKEIESRFDLVLISDYMDQSLVLLADLLCLPMEEVATLRLNKRDQDNIKGEAAKRISAKARRWNKADAALFDYFNKTLWRKVEQYGFEKMLQTIKELHNEVKKLKTKCIENDEPVPYDQLKDTGWTIKLYEPKGVKVTGFQLKPEAKTILTCVQLVSPERVSFDVLNKTQTKLSLSKQNI